MIKKYEISKYLKLCGYETRIPVKSYQEAQIIFNKAINPIGSGNGFIEILEFSFNKNEKFIEMKRIASKETYV